jgi:hypothetical protein
MSAFVRCVRNERTLASYARPLRVIPRAAPHTAVIAGLDPAIHDEQAKIKTVRPDARPRFMDGRVKPGHDADGSTYNDANRIRWFDPILT